MTPSIEDRANRANRVTWIGMIANLCLAILKLAAGILGSSQAMLADAVNSISDIATDVVVLLGFSFVRKPADHDHKYGHGKYETLATVIIGAAVFVVGLEILWNGGKNIVRFLQGANLSEPGWIALVAAALTIVIKEALYRLTLREGQEIQSQAVIAKAWDHRSDALASTGVLLGIGGAIILGDRWAVLDPIAAVVVSIFIMRVAVRIVWSAAGELLEASLGEKTERDIMRIVHSVPGILDAHALKTRRIGATIAVDLHIEVQCTLSISEAHDIATEVEERIRAAYGPDTLISIHVEPR